MARTRPTVREVFQFQASPASIVHPICRRILVPTSYSFRNLHVAIQDAIGWLNYHLHTLRLPALRRDRPVEIGIPEHESKLEWVGGSYDPEEFDPAGALEDRLFLAGARPGRRGQRAKESAMDRGHKVPGSQRPLDEVAERSAMDYIKVNSAQVPVIGFGTYKLTGDECAAAVEEALRIGYRHLDTAEMYKNEEAVASGIKTAGLDRSELFITTKVWMDDLSPGGLRRSLAGSLERLDTDYVDLWLVHWPNPAFPLRDTLTTMGELAEEGKVRLLGVSNFPSALFEEAAQLAPIVCNQVEYHPYLAQNKVLAAARAHGAFVTAFAPIARGKVQDDPVLREIGERHQKTPAQVAVRWLIQQGDVVAIPKSSHPERMRENIDIFDFALTREEVRRIDSLARGERLIVSMSGLPWDDD